MNESDRYEPSQLLKAFQNASSQGAMMESALYHLGRFYDQSFKQLGEQDDERYANRQFSGSSKQKTDHVVIGPFACMRRQSGITPELWAWARNTSIKRYHACLRFG